MDDSDEAEQLHDQFQMEDDDEYELDKTVDHVFKDGLLILKVRYQGANMGKYILEVPFAVLKKYIPLELAKYVRDSVPTRNKMGNIINGQRKRFKHIQGVLSIYIGPITLVVHFV
jgi:hypothetical protein